MNLSMTKEFLKEIGVGRRPVHDSFFTDSYETCKVFQRTGVVIEDTEELCHEVVKDFICNAPGCNASFQNLLDYEVHYNSTHRFICSVCKKIKLSARLLEIHIEENHDSFFQVLTKTKPMYQCFVSACEMKFTTDDERKQHCIETHKYPKHFQGSDKAKKKPISEKAPQAAMEIDEEQQAMKNSVSTLSKNQKTKTFNPRLKNIEVSSSFKNNPPSASTNSTSALAFIPRQLLQKSYAKVLTQDQKMVTDAIENNSIMDLAEALP